MTTSRFSSLSLASLLLAAACGGEPGAPIPDQALSPIEPPPPVVAEPSPGAPDPVKPPGTFSLKVTVEGTGNVRSEPAGIDCSAGTCTATFAPGTHVTLTSVPAEGWKLTGWRGACAGSGACALVLATDTAVVGSLTLLDARWDPSVGKQDCANAWGNAGEKLSSCDTTKDDYVVVRKSKRNTALCKNGTLVKNLRTGLGTVPVGAKEKQGDGKTPEGVFYVPRVMTDSAYYKAFALSYPTPADAQKGLQTQLITAAQRSQIEGAHAACVEPPQGTALGGDLAINGNGSSKDWTIGSIALDDAAVDLLWGSIGVGDTIVVLP